MEILLIKEDMAIFPNSPFVLLDQSIKKNSRVYATEMYSRKIDFVSLRGIVTSSNSSKSRIKLKGIGRTTINMELEL